MPVSLEDFIRESNRIESIHRAATQDEIDAHIALLLQRRIMVGDLECFVSLVQPGAVLRREAGQNVRVGEHRPPPGGPAIERTLERILVQADEWRAERSYELHCQYETLHPFTDGNGRSGRVLWLWMMGGIDRVPLGFLHTFYYQALQEGR